MPIIEVNHVTKEYQLGQLQSLKTAALNQWRRLTGQPVERRTPFKALNDVSFNIEAGEVVGIIGHNGAGKSTMLKLLANISKPTSGSLTVKGKVAPLIEVGTGLVGDLTGRENIYLNGTILGISKVEIRRKFDDIVAFAELEEFIDTPIKRYSSGMQVRLGFSIATSVESDILIVDEVLAVGDMAFQRKCFDRMEDLIKGQGKTVLVVSHNIRQIERLCSRVILLDKGRVIIDSAPIEVCNRFFDISNDKVMDLHSTKAHEIKTDEIDLIDVHLIDCDGNHVDQVTSGHSVSIVMTFQINSPLSQVNFGAGIHTVDFIYLTTNNWTQEFPPIDMVPGNVTVTLRIPCLPLLPRQYSLRLGVSIGEMHVPIYYAESILQFKITSQNSSIAGAQETGFFAIEGHWDISIDESPINVASKFEAESDHQVGAPENNTKERLAVNNSGESGR